MRYLVIIITCEIMAFVALAMGNATTDAIAARFGTGLTGFAAIGHASAIVLCGLLVVAESIRTIRKGR